MLIQSQPLDPKFCEKMGLNNDDEDSGYSDEEIKKQFIGEMFDDIFDESEEQKISLRLRITWFFRSIDDSISNIKYAIRNHFKWRKIIRKLRPWEGYSGLLSIMKTHLNDYIEYEKKYGHSTEEYRKLKIAAVKETLEILERLENHDNYTDKPLAEVKSRYPDYKGLVTTYIKGGSSYCGDFIPQGNGWTGKESGNDPREGYFEFINGRFQPTESPNQSETNRLLEQLNNYHLEISNAYKQGELDSDKDFDRLGQLLKDNLFTWWD